MTRRTGIVAALLILGLARTACAQTPLPPILREVGIDQHVGETIPLDLTFVDETGRSIVVRDYFKKKPVILVLAYYRCPMLCTQVLNGLVEALREIPETIGKDFEVVTVSFDPSETSDLAAAKKKTYVRTYGREGADQGWHFLHGKQDSISSLTRSVGYRYTYDTQNKQFAHAAAIMVLTPSGKISRYFLDVRYPAEDVSNSLQAAAKNETRSAIAQILLYCLHYDPAAGRYGVLIMRLVRIGGVATLIGLALFFAWLFRQDAARTASGMKIPPTEPMPLSGTD